MALVLQEGGPAGKESPQFPPQAETNNSYNNTEEVDLRSIEAENLGDDDELDADLEREFLQQQEAKRLWEEEDRRSVGSSRRTSTATDANDEGLDDPGSDVVGGLAIREMPDPDRLASRNGGEDRLLTLSSAARLEEMRDAKPSMQTRQNRLRELLLVKESKRSSLGWEFELRGRDLPATATGGSPSAWNDTMLTLFPEFVASTTLTKKTTGISNGGGGGELGRDDEIPERNEEIFEVPVPTRGTEEEAPSSSWLRLGLPSNSMKCAHSNEDHLPSPSLQRRRIRSASSSKLSVRTGTSLERQYSTGSTSTVESPILLVHERKRSISSRPPREPHSSGGGGRLTFSFPGWDIDISKGEKHPSVVNHNHGDTPPEAFGRPPKRLRDGSPSNPSSSTASRGKAVEEDLGDRSPVMDLPDEILFRILRRLNVQDLCSSVQTCKRWYAVGLQNDLWEHFLGGVDCGMLSDSSSDLLPRWVCKKNVSLSETVRLRFNVFSKGYDYLRRALHAWWNNGLLSSRYSSKGVYSLIRKLTVNDWSLLYEALGVAFIDRTDRIANMLLQKSKPVPHSATGKALELILAEKRDSSVDIGSLAVLYEKPKSSSYIRNGSSSEFEVHWKSGSIKEVSQEEGVIGKELWESLLVSWQKYKAWLRLISTHCPDLNLEVNIERARSEVVLGYGLRNVLQAGFMYLTTQDARDCISDKDMDLLRASHHMLQELDVADDFTLPVKSHTQTKLRQCFRSALSTNSKLALHMNDKYNDS